MYVSTYIFGLIPIEMWEILVLLCALFVIYLAGSAIRKRNIQKKPEYRYFVWGMWTKVFGGLFFAAIYLFYYGGGDTTSYYECSYAFYNLFFHDISRFFEALFGDGSPETKSLFTAATGEPMMYMFSENATRFTMKMITPFMILTGGSYILTTLAISIFTYGSLWQLFRMFVSYFPEYTRELAIAVLFMPSVMFWGSGILKDSFTLAATCYYIVAFNNIVRNKGFVFWSVFRLVLFAYVVVSIKAYIMLILLPSSMIWFMYSRISKVRNRLIRQLVVPFVYLVIVVGSYAALKAFGDSFGKFSIDKALKTASVAQNDLKQDYYEGNSFDIGDFEPTLAGVLSKFPVATMAGLFRPYLWDVRNVVMLLSALENLFLLYLTIQVIFIFRYKRMFQFIGDNPLILYCLAFSIFFAFMIGLTSPNFGALVRFKIPLIPLYVSCLFILRGELRKKEVDFRRDLKRNKESRAAASRQNGRISLSNV